MAMEGKGVPSLDLVVSKVNDDGLCAMYLGSACAFFALKSLAERESANQKCAKTRDTRLVGSAHLLGLIGWRLHKERAKGLEKFDLLCKLQAAEREINELKRRRSEDAKANEKVVSIYAVQKQNWFTERRKLQQQIGGLLNDLRILNKRKSETISDLNGELKDMEILLKSKDKMLEDEDKKRKELEEKVKSMEVTLEELREATKREAQDHSSELLKHKTALIELVSNQRQLEAELGRALRQVEATRQQFDFVFKEKEEAGLMVQELYMEVEKMHRDSEQKDKILSAMARKSKLELAEKEMLLKEVKLNKPKRKKAGIETERWWTISFSRNARCTLRHLLSRQVSSRLDEDKVRSDQNEKVDVDLDAEVRVQHEDYSLHLEQSFPPKNTEFDQDEWVHLKAEKYRTVVKQQHQLELDAFAQQMQLKDDKLEGYRWQLVNTELESKRLKTQIEGFNKDMSQLRHDNLKLESLLLDREEELKSLKDQIALKLNNFDAQKTKVTLLSEHKKPSDGEQQTKKGMIGSESKKEVQGGGAESVTKDASSTVLSSLETIEVKGALVKDNLADACISVSSLDGCESTRKEAATRLSLNKTDKPMRKMDLHALGLSYKIKRLNQQLLMLERLTGKQESVEVKGRDEHGRTRMKGFLLLLSLLDKQVNRYQSLQEKTDDLSQRMGEKDLHVTQVVPSSMRTKDDTKALEHFLEETFQLQRFVVATGQKLMEIQTKIDPGFVGISEELDLSASFDMRRFAETIQTLFKDVQRGLEVRIARIIGDLEGILACDGIHSWKQ